MNADSKPGTSNSSEKRHAGREAEAVFTKPDRINENWFDLVQQARKAREQGNKMRAHLRATGKGGRIAP